MIKTSFILPGSDYVEISTKIDKSQLHNRLESSRVLRSDSPLLDGRVVFFLENKVIFLTDKENIDRAYIKKTDVIAIQG